MHTDPPPVLMPIDVQMGFDFPPWRARWPDTMEVNGLKLLDLWRAKAWPIVHVRHASANSASSLHASHAGHAFRPGFEPLPHEKLVTKSVNSAFIGTDLSDHLETLGRPPLVAFGVSGDMCVSTTVRMAANLGHHVTLISDACWCFDLPLPDGSVMPAQTVHAAHMATLAFEFCSVMTAGAYITEITQSAR